MCVAALFWMVAFLRVSEGYLEGILVAESASCDAVYVCVCAFVLDLGKQGFRYGLVPV